MTKRRTGWYVTARMDRATAWLLGPFETHRAAASMVEAVSHACRAHMSDPRYADASYGTAKLTSDKLPAGRLPLDRCVDEVWISCVIFGGYRHDR